MGEAEQITEAEQLAVPDWIHQLASNIVLGRHGVGTAGVLIQRAFEERERAKLHMALLTPRKVTAVGGETRFACRECGVSYETEGEGKLCYTSHLPTAMIAALKDTQP